MNQNGCTRWICRLCGVMALVLLLVLLPGLSTGTQAQAAQTGIPVEENPELFKPRSMPTHGEGKLAVFLIEFPDCPNDNPNATVSYYEGLYFNGGIDLTWANYNSISDFYYKHSYGKLKLSGQVFDWYTTKHERAYYETHKNELVLEAAEYYMAQGVDFSRFDGNKDGIIDGIVYHFAGPTTSETGAWYDGLYTGTWSDAGFGSIGSLKFTTMIQINEEAGTKDRGYFSTICHELLHSLGMADLYGMGYDDDPVVDLMAHEATYINPYYKLLLGWIDMANVQIITKDTKNIRLDLSGEALTAGTGDVDIAIVTDSYQGLYDEFYLVIYRRYAQYIQPTIYHIDARLNEAGTAFLCDNYLYDPRPDKENKHGVEIINPSTHLFMEELSASTIYNHVVSSPPSLDDTAFGPDSVLGPNSVPSSDTHDGGYTGIKIYNFVEHNDQYLTFDVAFVTDKAAPQVATQESELQFQETVTLQFSEYIYEGSAWKDIRVTDLEGNPLQAKIILPHYPHFEMEIQFTGTAYEAGYKIVLPRGAVKDSSGNPLAAITLTASNSDHLLPMGSLTLPNPTGYSRTNEWPKIFLHDNDMVVFSRLLATSFSKFEFLRIDLEGKVLRQTIVENPFKSDATFILEAENGSYICICQNDTMRCDNLLFCLGKDGKVKWVNSDLGDKNISLGGGPDYLSYTWGDLVFVADERSNSLYSINAVTGEAKPAPYNFLANTDPLKTRFFDIAEETVLLAEGGHLQLIDKASGKTKLETQLPGVDKVSRVNANDDGTLILLCSANGKSWAYLLDARLEIVKTITLQSTNIDISQTIWLENDGFCEAIPLDWGGHIENTQYHIRRYDRYLNLIWKTDASADCMYYYKSASGEIMGLKSVSHPQSAFSIERYGSEDNRKTPHTHTLEHIKAKAATCSAAGNQAYWRCGSCGCIYSDEGKSLVTDGQSLVIPATGRHREETVPGTAPGCTTSGLSDGLRCGDCKITLREQESLPALGHTTNEEAGCTDVKRCTRCGKTEVLGHSFGQWSVKIEATTEAEGLMVRSCGRCGTEETQPIDKLSAPTVPPEPSAGPTEPPATPEATADKTTPTNGPSADEEPAPENSSGGIILIGVAAGLICIGVTTGVILRKKRK